MFPIGSLYHFFPRHASSAGNFKFQFMEQFQITINAVIPSEAKRNRGIFAPNQPQMSRKCVDFSTRYLINYCALAPGKRLIFIRCAEHHARNDTLMGDSSRKPNLKRWKKMGVYFLAKMCYTTIVCAGWADPGTLSGSCATRLRRYRKITYYAGVFLWNGDTGPEKRTAVAYFSCRNSALTFERSLYFGRKTENYPPWRFG